MNTDRLREDNEKEARIRAQMHEVLDIVLDGNGFERRSRRNTGTLPTLFFRYSGHVADFEVDLHVDGWEPCRSYDREWLFHTNTESSDEYINSLREAVRAALAEKTETEILRRDVLRQEGKVKDEKEKLSEMKRTLRRKERKEKAAAGTTT